MADLAFQQIAALEQRVTQLRDAARLETADGAIAADLARFDASATIDGVYVADSSGRARYEDGRREQYDASLRDAAEALERDHAALLQTVSEATAAFRRIQLEDQPGLSTMRELAALTRYRGRALAQLERVYTATTDAENATLVHLVETDIEAFRLTPHPETDVQAIQDLRRAIEARRSARIPEGYRGAVERAQAVLSGLHVRDLIGHLKSGRGVARRPLAATTGREV